MLDAHPMALRPDTLLPLVLDRTHLPIRDASVRSFGEWTFDYQDIDRGVWDASLATLKNNITCLFHENRIRYGCPS